MTLAQKISADNFRFLEDVFRAIDGYKKEIDELLSLQKMYIKQTAALTLEVNLGGEGAPKNSPKPEGKPDIKVSNMNKLRQNYTIIQQFWDTREELDRLATRVRQDFASRGEDTSAAVAEIMKLKKKADVALEEAFTFLSNLASENLPKKFVNFNGAIENVLSKSISYEDIKQFTYIYEVGGDIAFSTYFQLLRVRDEDGTYYTDLYVVTSYKTGETAECYIAVLSKFVPPSERLLMKKVNTVKETVRALNILFSLDNFTTSIGSIPISLLLKDSKVDKSLFLYQNFIKSVTVDESKVVFVLKPEVQEQEVVDKVISQMYLDFQTLIKNKNIHPKMFTKKAEKCWTISFFFPPPRDGVLASEGDLTFLKERFNLSDSTIKNVVRTINQGS